MTLKRKIAYIDLTNRTVQTKAIPVEMREKFIGGRGLDMYLLYNHVPPNADPLGPENVLLISAGLLVGTLASGSGRTHVGAKSPLTGRVGSTNMGGFFSPELRWAGFDHLVIKGRAAHPVYLWVHDGEIEIRDAKNVWGKTTHETQQVIRQELDDRDIKVMTIGPGGERLVRYANVMTGLKNAGGRSGMGTVMGSKNLKAVAVRGTMDIKIAHPQEALDYNYKIITDITSAKVNQTLGILGTMFIFGATNTQGLIRARNFIHNQIEYADNIEAEAFEEYATGMVGCFGCQVHCRPKHVIPEGPYAGVYEEGPEYTGQGAFGSEVGCTNTLTVLEGQHVSNIYGIDILEVGSMIAWAMELYEKGILTNKDTGGLDLRFGNDQAVIEMIHRIGRREGLGDILAEGPIRAAEIIGRGADRYLVHVKGMSNLQSDERATPGLALNIATSSRGSDHLRSRPALDLYHLPEPVLRKLYSQPVPYNGPLTSDYQDYDGKPWMVYWHELLYEAVDSLGMCKFHTIFMAVTVPNWEEFSRLIYTNTGLEMTPVDLWNAADRAYTMERLFNIREGLTRKEDWLVDRYFDEPAPLGIPSVRGSTIDRVKFNKMLDQYYEHHGWDKNGVPLPETLKKLGLDKEPSHIL